MSATAAKTVDKSWLFRLGYNLDEYLAALEEKNAKLQEQSMGCCVSAAPRISPEQASIEKALDDEVSCYYEPHTLHDNNFVTNEGISANKIS